MRVTVEKETSNLLILLGGRHNRFSQDEFIAKKISGIMLILRKDREHGLQIPMIKRIM